jgi:hypothetical protein
MSSEGTDHIRTSQSQAQADTWTIEDGNEKRIGESLIVTEKQWDRITERGTVLSRYIYPDYKTQPMNFAVCENKSA